MRVRRVLAISTIAVVAILAAALLVLHSTPVQSRILNWSITELERRFDLNLTADDLRFNLATRRVTLRNLKLAARGHQDQPFFAAGTVTVRLPWAAYRGQLRFDDIAVEQGHVNVYRDASGVSNLPPGRGRRDPNAPPRKIDARGLTVRDLNFSYRDLQRDIEIVAPHVRTDLAYALGEGAKGPFAIDGDLIVRTGKRKVVIEPVKGDVVFDGTNLGLAGMRIKSAEGDITVDGPITRVLDQPTLDLTLKGSTSLDRASFWTAPPIHVGGAATLDATMKGAPSEFVFEARVSAPDAEVGHERGVRIEADAVLTPSSIKVSKGILHPATGGEIVTTLDMPFGQNPWWLIGNYSGVDAAAAFRLAEVKPLPFGAALEGTARLDAKPGQPFRLELHNTATPRAVRGTAPLAGTVEFFVEGDRWRANQKHRLGATTVSGEIGGIWNRQAVTRSTFSGKLDAQVGDIGDVARTAALFGFSMPAIIRDSRGPLTANITMGGEFNAPRFVGTARTGGVDVPSVGTAAFTTDFDASARAVNITNIDGTIGTARINGEYLANLATRSLGGKLFVEAPSARDLLTVLPDALRLDGALSATATLGGTVDAPDILTTVAGNALTLGGQPVDSLTATARILGNDVIVENLTLTQAAGSVKATGRYSIASRTYTVDVQGQGLQWQGGLARLGSAQALVSVKFSGSGTVDRPMGQGTIEFDLTGGLAGALIGHGTADVRLDGTTALVTAKIPTLGASVDAKIAIAKPFAYDAVLVANKVDLEQLIRLAGLREGYVVGTASVNATASGTLADAARSRVFVNLQEIDASVEGVPLKLAAPSRLTWDGVGLTVDTLDLSVGQAGRLHASGRLSSTDVANAKFDSTFAGELGDLLRIGRPFGVPPALQASGPVAIAWRSTGGLQQSTGSLQLAGGSLTWGTFPTVNNLSVDASFNGSSLDVARLTGQWQGGGIEGTASVPRGVLEEAAGLAASPATAAASTPGFAKLRVTGLTQAAFAPWLSKNVLSSIDGKLSATLDTTIARASLDGVTGRLTLDEANFVVGGVPVAQVRPSVLTIQGGTVTAQDVVWRFGNAEGTGATQGGVELILTGTARLAPADTAALDFQVQGTADLRVLSAFAPTIAVDGNAKVNVGIGGPPSAPVFSGRVDVADAEVLIREPRIVLGGLAGTIAFDGRRVLVDSFTGTANGGALVLDGGFLLSGARAVGGALTLQMQGAALEYPRGLQSESDALLIIRPDATGWSLTGDVIVARSVFNEPISIAALAAARQTRAPRPPGEDSKLEQLHLNFFVSTQEDLRVDNNYARFEASAAIRVMGTADEPVLGGRITLQEGGEVYLAGRTFHITRGNIFFTDPSRIEPEFDVELATRVGGTEIILTLDGPMDELQTDVRSSDPDIDSREAMSLLFGNMQGEDAVTLLSAELLGVTGRAVGLDALRLERGFETDEFRADPGLIATEVDPATRLTISKRLRPDVEVILSQSLKESGGLSTILSYKPKRNVELRFVSRDNLDRAVSLRHEITFGGGQTGQIERAAQPEISAVTFSGDLKFPETELRSLLKLKAGDRFDFYNWQRDQDELRDHYQDLNYYEVRVRGSRQPAEDGRTIVLTYQINSGPLAELAILGHQLEPGLEDELRDAWRRTIFDRFLIQDFESRILRHLVGEEIIGSTVKAAITVSTPERKRAEVTVQPGTTVSSRRIQYTGNATFEAGDLDRVIEEQQIDIEVWLAPTRAAEEIERYYRNRGFLEVAVKAAEPRVEGGDAVLPVTVEEGRRFGIDAITFKGVHPDRQVEVARAANLTFGSPYVTEEIDLARRRIRDYYGQHGFNSAQVELEPVPESAEGVVDVDIIVTEGPEQILREVVTEGSTKTRDGVIDRALRLRPGDPVNLAAWSQARKRLYDTNVFRQVDIEPISLDATPDEKAAGIQPVKAVVRVIEYPVWRVRYGLQLNDEKTSTEDAEIEERQQSLGVIGELRNQNLFGRAYTAGISGRVERDRRSESMFLSNASFFGLPLRSQAFIFDARQRFRVDTEIVTITDTQGFSAEQRWRPSRRGEVSYGFRYERNHTFDPSPPPGEVLPFDSVLHTPKITAAGLLDRRDDPFEPSRGWFSSVNMEHALAAFGSDYGNTKVLVQQLYFLQLNWLVLATRAQVGASSGDLVPTERFFLGGATTVRGYGENALGPRNSSGDIAGGERMLLFNGEARFHVRGWVQGVAFVDAGNVFTQRLDLITGEPIQASRKLTIGYGIGLRLASPFAMFRLDFGIPGSAVSPDQPKPKGRFYFGIGHIF